MGRQSRTIGRSLAGAVVAFAIATAPGNAWSGEAAVTPTTRTKETRAIVEAMVSDKGFESMTLSPDGKHIAAIAWTGTANTLILIDTDTEKARTIFAPTVSDEWIGVLQPLNVSWISDTLLAVDSNDGNCSVMDLDGQVSRVLGDHFIRMIEPEGQGERAQWAIVGAQGLFGAKQIRRVNVYTGESDSVPLGLPGEVTETVFDKGGRLRAATTLETKWFAPGAKITNWYRHDEQSPWQQVAQAPVTDDLWIPIGVPDVSDTLVVLSRDGRDTWAMFTYDVATRRTTDLLVGHPTEDLTYFEDDAKKGLIRVVTDGLKPATYWFDARWDQLQRSVDAALPNAVNGLSGDPHGMVLVFSRSDRDPGRWLLLDTQHMTLKAVAEHHLGAQIDRMRPMQTLTYAAADGLTIPAYLTLPEGPAQPRPMVVYIHGGPVARDEWGWNFDVQVLAAAGYAVFQPQFRGSRGFGRKFEHAGYRQWGLAMQDDVTAGVKEMIARGIADPKRICTYGASYGGYAALWGLVKTPELYQCGVSLAGVTDLAERFTDWSDTNAHAESRELMRFEMGDADTMAAQFAAVSPEKHADQIRVPVLLAHGSEDERVPIGHSKRMAAALEAAHKPVETHWYAEERHRLSKVRDIVHFEAALLDFLDRNIGPASPAAASAQAPAR